MNGVETVVGGTGNDVGDAVSVEISEGDGGLDGVLGVEDPKRDAVFAGEAVDASIVIADDDVAPAGAVEIGDSGDGVDAAGSGDVPDVDGREVELEGAGLL